MTLTRRPAGWTELDWLEWRRNGIGGSDIASLCGLSRFSSPMSCYADKLNLAPDRPASEAAQWGNLLETAITDEFERRTGYTVTDRQSLAVDDTNPWRRATIDGLTTRETLTLGTCQIKTSYQREWDGIPDEYAVQIQWEMGLTGQPRAWLPVLHAGQRLGIYEADADPEIFSILAGIVDRFWHEHILTRRPPPADALPSTRATLTDIYPTSVARHVTLDGPALAAARRWTAAKQAVATAEEELDLITNEIRAALGDADTALIDTDAGPVEVATWKTQTSTRVDTTRLRAEHPEIAEQCTTQTTTRVLRPTKGLANLEQQRA